MGLQASILVIWLRADRALGLESWVVRVAGTSWLSSQWGSTCTTKKQPNYDTQPWLLFPVQQFADDVCRIFHNMRFMRFIGLPRRS